jgi:hypothetical protein
MSRERLCSANSFMHGPDYFVDVLCDCFVFCMSDLVVSHYAQSLNVIGQLPHDKLCLSGAVPEPELLLCLANWSFRLVKGYVFCASKFLLTQYRKTSCILFLNILSFQCINAAHCVNTHE